MLEVARETAELAGVDARPAPRRHARPAGRGRVPAGHDPVPHAAAHGDRRTTGGRCCARSRRHLAPGGRFVFDVFTPSEEDIAETHGRWLEREPGIWERADWDESTRTLILRVRGETGESEMSLAWLDVPRVEGAALATKASRSRQLYGWFDRTAVATAARTRSTSAAAPARETARSADLAARGRAPGRRSATRRSRSGSSRRRRARPRPAALRARRRAGRRRGRRDRPTRAARRRERRARPVVPPRSSQVPSGTRQIEPALARSAFGDGRVGAAVGERDRRAERVGRADQRADVARDRRRARARASHRARSQAGRSTRR